MPSMPGTTRPATQPARGAPPQPQAAADRQADFRQSWRPPGIEATSPATRQTVDSSARPQNNTMSLQLYCSFLVAALVLVYTPGPVNVLTMSQALHAGWRRALPCVWGGTLAVLLQLALTALCLNSLLLVSEHSLTVLRWLGAAYLVWLGCKQWRSRSLAGADTPLDSLAPAPNDAANRRALFWRGFATSGLNPKTLLFFPSFFPQFMSADAAWSANRQYLLLAATFALLFAAGVASMALFSHRLRHVLQRPKRLRAVNRLMGGLLVGMGAMMAGLR